MNQENMMDQIEVDLPGYEAAGNEPDCITEFFDLSGKAVE